MLSIALDETGGVVTSEFDRWLAAEQKDQATIMKQYRLFAEEQHADDGRREGRADRPEKGKKGKAVGRGKDAGPAVKKADGE